MALISDLNSIDEQLFKIINTPEILKYPKVLDEFMLLISSNYFWIFLFLIMFIVFFIKKRFYPLKILVLALLAMSLSDLFAYRILKPLAERKRPCHSLEDLRLVSERCGGEYGFPSNHAANGFAAAVFVSLNMRRKRIFGLPTLFIGAAFLVGLSRVYLGVHYPFDVLFGFVVGSVVAVIANFALKLAIKHYAHLQIFKFYQRLQ
ncbi:MAG: phosphatase PAP2 family protein [Oligoflexales bacterium]|nr:phosphatase PAP2 family protein [Oligoflexales bacterium]